jgi:leucyl-tRNA synthetase
VLSYEEELVRNTMHDIREVLRLAKVEKPKAIYLFTAPSWKYTLFKKVHGLLEETQHPGEILKKVIEHEELRKHGKAIAKFLPKMISSRKIPSVLLACEDELKTIEEAADFLKTEYGCKIMVSNAEKSAEQKAQQATPGKVAILVE